MLIRICNFSIYFILLYFFIAGAVKFPVDSSTGKVSYTEIVIVDSSLTKEILYKNAREWAAKAFVSVQNVIQMDDKEGGTLILKGLIKTGICNVAVIGPSDYVAFTMSIYTKNGRYKYLIADLYHKPLDPKLNDRFQVPLDTTDKTPRLFLRSRWLKTKENTDMIIKEFITSFKNNMSSNKIKKENDW